MTRAWRLLQGIGSAWMRRNHPGLLVLFITDRCNCRCAMCFNAANVFNASRAPDLALEHIARIAQSLHPLPQLLLSGGEPFLRDDVPEIVRLFCDHAGTLQVSIPTNATLPQRTADACERILQACPGVLLNVNLSLDGIEEAHDAFRGLSGCYERVCDTYARLAALRDRAPRLTVNIITVITGENVADAPGLLRAIRARFRPNYHAVGLLRNDPGEAASNRILDFLEAETDVVNFEKESFQGTPVFASLAPALSAVVKRLAIRSRREQRRCFRCLAGARMIVITNDGRLMPCEPLWLEPEARRSSDINAYCMAHLAEYAWDVKTALRNPCARSVRHFVGERKCWCTYGCAIQNGVMYSPSRYPALFREMFLAGKKRKKKT